MRRIGGLSVLLSLALLSACSSSSSTTATSATSTTPALDGDITLYSGQHEQTVAAMVGAFQQQAHIKVNVRSDDEATLANQILEEGSASPADVFFGENPSALNVLDAKHLFAPTATATLAAVPSIDSPTSRAWVGVSARAVALVYNTAKIQDASLPTSILDFAKPEWKGRIGIAPGETDFQPIVTVIVKLDGVDAATAWLKALKTNAKVYDDNEALVAAVNRGEVLTGVIDHYYWYRLQDEVGASKISSALHYFAAGDPGSLVDVSGAGQLATSKHPKSAQAFLAFLVSKQAQDIIATSESYEYPLAAGVTTAKPLRPFADFGAPVVSINDLGDGRQALQLLQQVGLL